MWLKKGLLSLSIVMIGLSAKGQTTVIDTIPDYNPEYLDECLDSLVNQWYVSKSATNLVLDSIPVNDSISKYSLPDSVYINRLSEISSPINYTFNSKVKSYIELYTIKRREQVQTMLGLSQYYFPMFEEVLDSRQMPIELKYLPIIESALNPRAYSRAGASGLWQFMYYTGKQYGLRIDSYVDERRDPYRSSVAAADFLQDLYDIYKDWLLVIAAYNCGPGNVNKAIRRSGGHRDFWKIYYHLPKETRGYVPAFIAATYTFTYAQEHNLYAVASGLPIATDTIMVQQPLHLKQVSEMLNVNLDYLRELNPQYRRDVVPAKKYAFPLRLSFNLATEFAAYEDTIYAHKRNNYFPGGALVSNPEYTQYTPSVPKDKTTVWYTVKSGDAVGLIADWYDVRTSDLRYWNNVRGNLIKVGQKLAVYVPKHKVDYYKKINQMSYAEKQRLNGRSSGSTTTASKTQPVKEDSNYIYYTVRSGDSLWSIAQKYNGVSNSDIMRLNNLSSGAKIKPGQKLKIKPKA
ncbi:transglycosylase SLT domain-containing protein [Carboxylicivirga caseinilyticus]|uniref:lytic transglycosylase domain-containing protein n=1 Tax=Carboxylicivirga caseinilyticus TaxID=3417572 RepID=UPI003D327AAB|nr:LysM peptidoglycan-binding domain-containing protein [Marinilabiliaceae bacterium A049]